MSENHNHSHHDNFEDHHGHIHHHHSVKNLKTAFFLNFSFTLIEAIGGFFTNSIAILSDALHDLGDTLAIGMSWYFQKLSNKSRTQKFSYGYKRLSLVSALISAIILLVGSVLIIYKAIPRLFNPEVVHVEGMFVIAIIGVLVNGAAVLRLKKGHSSNERVVMLHLLEDVLGWAAVLLGSMLMYFFDWPFIDPLLSIAIALYILWNAFKNIKEFIRIFLQGIPKDIDLHEVYTQLNEIADVLSVHDVHIWSMDGDYNVFSAHLVVEDDISASKIIEIKKQARKVFRKLNISHETLEFEYKSEACHFEEC
ncbi:MAG: cation transporter [Calditrichaceae bacterium]|nr:cation transporter [Calditrichaceae bacterium]